VVKRLWPAEGIHHDLAPSTYFAPQPEGKENWIVSKSMLWDFSKNPSRWLESPPKTITDSMRWGSLIDCITLTPDRFASSYALQPENYVSKPEGDIILTTAFEGEWNSRTKVCRDWKAEQEAAGRIVMTPDQLAEASKEKLWNWNSSTCQAWREALPRHVEIVDSYTLAEAEKAMRKLSARPEVFEMIQGARTQVAMRFDFPDQLHGVKGINVPAKGLIDVVPSLTGKWGSHLVDLKTTAKLDDLDQIEKTIFNFGYHGQAALYLDMWNALTGQDREGFVFIFQLSVAPYEVAVVELDPSAIVAGREWYLKAITKWAETVSSGKWSSPWDGIKWAKLPKWSAGKEGR